MAVDAKRSEPGQIERLIMEMRGAIDDQHKTIEMLRRSLASVLVPRDEDVAARDGETLRAVRSPLSDQLTEAIGGVTASTALLHGIMHQLDL